MSIENIFIINENGLKARWKIQNGQNLDSGAFGEVFEAIEIATGNEVAVKVVSNRTRHPQLLHEAKLSRKMKE